MQLSKNALIAAGVIPLLAALIALAIYLLYGSLQSQQKANEEILQKFGFTISPSSPYTESTGVLGGKQLPATFAEDELSPVEKVIQGLIRDRDQLIDENASLQQRVDQLQGEVETLQKYKALNEHFAPDNFEQELEQVRSTLGDILHNLPETQKFSRSRLQMITDAGVREYRRYVESHHLMLSSEQRNAVIREPLVTYSFCLGNAIDLASNSIAEERSISAWFSDPNANPLPRQIRSDLEIVIPPCQQTLRAKLQQMLPLGASGG